MMKKITTKTVIILSVISAILLLTERYCYEYRMRTNISNIVKQQEKELNVKIQALSDYSRQYDLANVQYQKEKTKIWDDYTVLFKSKEELKKKLNFTILSSKQLKASTLTRDQILIEDQKKDDYINNLKQQLSLALEMEIKKDDQIKVLDKMLTAAKNLNISLKETLNEAMITVDTLKIKKCKKPWIVLGPGCGLDFKGRGYIGFQITIATIRI